MSESDEATVYGAAIEGESFSATVARLVDAGAKALRSKKKMAWIGAGEGPEDLGIRAEEYLRIALTKRK
ncbi:MAG: hypothetical protein ACYDCC_09475 [Actinomycetota bacterium]